MIEQLYNVFINWKVCSLELIMSVRVISCAYWKQSNRWNCISYEYKAFKTTHLSMIIYYVRTAR